MSQTLRTFTTAVALVDGLPARQQEDRLNRMRAKVSAITPKQPVRGYGVLTETDVSTQLVSELDHDAVGPTQLDHDAAIRQFWDAVLDDDVDTVQAFPGWKNKPFDDGSTPLMTASREGSQQVATYLVQAGADVNKQAPSGQTPLILAACNRHLEIVELLLANGADLTKVLLGWTALQHAEWLDKYSLNKSNKDKLEQIIIAIRNKMGENDA